MTTLTMGGVPARRDRDRNAFLVFVALVWVGVLSGFGTDSVRHVAKHGFDYPLIVHVHAIAFVSWLVLFTTQVALIRVGRPDVHRRLGTAAVALAGVMLLLGPATAVTVDALQYARHGDTPEFLAVQFSDMLAFAILTGAGLLLRADAAAHKRLMMLGLFYISNAGFARFLGGAIALPFGETRLGEVVGLYVGGDLLVLALGVYDLVTRRRLHPAYLAGVAVVLAAEVIGDSGLHSAGWKAISMHLIGH